MSFDRELELGSVDLGCDLLYASPLRQESRAFVLSLGGRDRDDFTVSGKGCISRLRPYMSQRLDLAFGLVSPSLAAQPVPSPDWRAAFPHSVFFGACAEDVIASLNQELTERSTSGAADAYDSQGVAGVAGFADDYDQQNRQLVQALHVLIDGTLARRKSLQTHDGAAAPPHRPQQEFIKPSTRVGSSASDGSIPWVLAGDVWRLAQPLNLSDMYATRAPGRYRLVATRMRVQPVHYDPDVNWDALMPLLNNAFRVLRAVGLRNPTDDETEDVQLQRSHARHVLSTIMSYKTDDIYSTAALRAYEHQEETRAPRARGRPAPTFHPEKIDDGEGQFALPQLKDLVFDLGTVTVQEMDDMHSVASAHASGTRLPCTVHLDREPRWNVELTISRGMQRAFHMIGQRNIEFEWVVDLELVSEFEMRRAHMESVAYTKRASDEDDLPSERSVKRRGPPPRPALAATTHLVPLSTKVSMLHPAFLHSDRHELVHALVARDTVRAEAAPGVLPHPVALTHDAATITIRTSNMQLLPSDAVRIGPDLCVEKIAENQVRHKARERFGVFIWVKSMASLPHDMSARARSAVASLLHLQVHTLYPMLDVGPTTDQLFNIVGRTLEDYYSNDNKMLTDVFRDRVVIYALANWNLAATTAAAAAAAPCTHADDDDTERVCDGHATPPVVVIDDNEHVTIVDNDLADMYRHSIHTYQTTLLQMGIVCNETPVADDMLITRYARTLGAPLPRAVARAHNMTQARAIATYILNMHQILNRMC